MSEYTCSFAHLIDQFVEYREKSNKWRSQMNRACLRIFDRYCTTFTDTDTLTQEMADSWCRRRSTESARSHASRIAIVTALIKYLKERGLTDIRVPEKPRCKDVPYIPHGFTEDELSKIFNSLDNIERHNNGKNAAIERISIPVFFRLLYSSGMRMFEARMLKVKDVDLNTGVVSIKISKNDNQHFVVLHDTMLALLQKYNAAIEKICPNRELFFPSYRKKVHPPTWVSSTFQKVWQGISKERAVAYDLRHNYAIENINRWTGLGLEFNDKLTYLSKSMGHSSLERTREYYALTSSITGVILSSPELSSEDIIPSTESNNVK